LPGAGGINTFPDVATQRANTSALLPQFQDMPKSINWELGIQHTFWSNYTVEVRYVGTRGIHLPAQIQINKEYRVTDTNFLPTFINNVPDQAAIDAMPFSLSDLKAAVPAVIPAWNAAGFGSTITSYQPWASSTYNGLAAQLTRRFANGLQGVLAYTYSHNIDDATAEVFSTVLAPRRAQDSQDLAADRSNSILDHRHRLTLSVIYDEPFFKNSNFFLKNTLGNWEVAPIYTYQSGQWVTAQSGIDSNLNGDSAPDRTIFNAGGVAGTGTGVAPLCRSAIPAFDTTGLNQLCTLGNAQGTAVPDGNNAADCIPGMAGCIFYNVQGNVVGYKALNPTGRYVEAGFGALANVGRNTLQLAPINDIDITAFEALYNYRALQDRVSSLSIQPLQPSTVRWWIHQRHRSDRIHGLSTSGPRAGQHGKFQHSGLAIREQRPNATAGVDDFLLKSAPAACLLAGVGLQGRFGCSERPSYFAEANQVDG
jgi:hypothetical protein